MTTLTKNQKPQPEKTQPDKSQPEHSTGNSGAENADQAIAVILVDHLPLTRIFPSPLNPRKHFDAAALAELAESIRVHGVQQPIVVRPLLPLPGRGRQEADGSLAVTRHDIVGGTLQIVMGERRFRAAQLAGLATIPCLLRRDVDDKKHAILALEENMKRADLSPMEEARGYKAAQDLGATQEEIGEGAGVQQARISSLVALLKLPEDVQELIGTGKISKGHGVALGRYRDFPALASHLAKMAADALWPVRAPWKTPIGSASCSIRRRPPSWKRTPGASRLPGTSLKRTWPASWPCWTPWA